MNRVLIVDDHAGFRRFARGLLQAEGVDVIGEAEDEASAVAAVARLRPGVVLLDVLCPGATASRSPSGCRSSSGARDRAHLKPAGRRVRRAAARGAVAGFVHKDDLSAAALAAVVG